MLRNTIILSIRNSIRNFRFTLINLIGLSLAISACLVIYSFINYELHYNMFHSDYNRTYRIVEQSRSEGSIQYYSTTAFPLAQAVRSNFPGIVVCQSAGPSTQVISVNNGSRVNRYEESLLLYADANYLKVFDFSGLHDRAHPLWLQGNAATAFSSPDAVILTETLAKKYFPDAMAHKESVIGKTLQLNHTELLTVTGVISDPPHNTSVNFTMLVNYEHYKKTNAYQANNWSGNYDGYTYIVLPPGADQEHFEKQLNAFKATYLNAEDNKKISYYLEPLKKIHQETLYQYSDYYIVSPSMILSLAGLGLFIMLIACINFINLATALGIKRTADVSIRKILGSSRFLLFQRFFMETALITLIAAAVSLALSAYIIQMLNRSLALIGLDLKVDGSTILFTLLITTIVALLAGIYPALLISAKKPLETVRGQQQFKGGLTLRRGLIVFQFFIAQSFIIGTVVMAKQMYLFQHKDMGFAKKAIVMIPVPDGDAGKMQLLRDRLKQNHYVSEVSFASDAPIAANQHYGTGFRLSQEPVNRMRDAEMKVVDSDYLKLYHLQLLSGHNIMQSNILTNGFNGLIVNETLVKAIGLNAENALGKMIVSNEGSAPIIGVVKDFNNNTLQGKITPCLLYYRAGYFTSAGVQLNAQNGNIADALAGIETTWRQIYPEALYKFNFLESTIADQYAIENMSYKASQLLSFVAILIGCLGLYGLVAFMAETRVREIGIRKVLGASFMGLISLFLSEFLKLLGIAFVIAAPVAFYLMRQWLSGFAYQTSVGPPVFLLAIGITILIAVCSVGYRAIMAVTANPVKNLKSE